MVDKTNRVTIPMFADMRFAQWNQRNIFNTYFFMPAHIDLLSSVRMFVCPSICTSRNRSRSISYELLYADFLQNSKKGWSGHFLKIIKQVFGCYISSFGRATAGLWFRPLCRHVHDLGGFSLIFDTCLSFFTNTDYTDTSIEMLILNVKCFQ